MCIKSPLEPGSPTENQDIAQSQPVSKKVTEWLIRVQLINYGPAHTNATAKKLGAAWGARPM